MGIVGETGAGKSTLISALAGRLPITKGNIEVDGMNVDEQRDHWYEKITYIPQHPYIFPLSLADNIRFYEPGATDESVTEMIGKIGLASLVDRFPNGINEMIGEGGRTLSGGQAQRIAVARALLSKKPIILLDEPTAHLDIETEYEIKQLMLDVFQDKMVLLATHRLHWMQNMNQVILLDNGKVEAKGSHESLLQNNAAYSQFVDWKRGEAQ